MLLKRADLKGPVRLAKSIGQIKTASAVLAEQRAAFDKNQEYTFFLSHSYRDVGIDPDVLLGIKMKLEDQGYSCYVDWIDDPELDRAFVTKKTAARLRQRMNNCAALLYVVSENHHRSKWMPWELGFFDGQEKRIAVVPAVGSSETAYRGQEYLGLYPYLSEDPREGDQQIELWVETCWSVYAPLYSWLEGMEPQPHRSHR